PQGPAAPVERSAAEPPLLPPPPPAAPPPEPPMAPPDPVPASAPPPPRAAGPGVAFEALIGTDWELAAGEEKYLCVRETIADTFYMSKLRSALSAGTHHVGLFVSDRPDRADGVTECSLIEVGERLVGGSGPGTQDLELPKGVAMKFIAGNQLLYQLHLFNAADTPLHGHSRASIATMAPPDVEFEAQQVAAQLVVLDIPRGRSTARGRCTFDRAQTLVAITPHMHRTGRHARVTLHSAGQSSVLHDADYDFTEQKRYALEQRRVAAGDYLEYECTYQNDSDRRIGFGESTDDEMCLFGTTLYPGGAAGVCLL
ncbi:MAG TPA: hypothetical protein VJR89_43180, partial [Polyangiales bacterium]|nr:hypothetical protein [Polyangiales bacterium]